MKSTGPKRHIIRTDIQCLRALAIFGVLGFHLWPKMFPLGYLGVDLFRDLRLLDDVDSVAFLGEWPHLHRSARLLQPPSQTHSSALRFGHFRHPSRVPVRAESI
uniref:Acyl_transf_3 domain-containing protein n=1 Tax=Panagrellus redivivus TaxID=6233 RepID=A0A7E4VT89_PANRE